MSKKASIVCINYNDKTKVCRAIESALNQTWQDVEVILVDDGSNQEVRDLYAPYRDRIKIVQLERDNVNSRTPGRARNKGAKVATGDYICFLDSDDYYASTFIEDMIKSDSIVSFCDWEIIGLKQKKIVIGQVWDLTKGALENYLQFNHLSHCGLLIKKELFDKVGGYDERGPLQRSEDCDFIVRLILEGSSWNYVPKTLFFVDKHEGDQQKNLASLYGKTLWTLKNGLNPTWLFGMISKMSPLLAFVYSKAIQDFLTDDIWEKDRTRYKIQLDSMFKQLDKEQDE